VSRKIKIVNPLPGGAIEMSRKRAEHFIRRGAAEYLPDGSLRFFEQTQGRRIIEQHGRGADRGEKKLYVWSGSRKGVISLFDSRPGISRS
jgi:hypothetical protein